MSYLQWLSQEAPETQLHHLMSGYWISAAMGVAAELHLADLMAEGPQPSVDVAQKTGMHPGALYRLVRTLASIGLFTEVTPGQFAVTAMGDLLRTDHPRSLYHLTRYTCTDRQWQRFGALRRSIETGESVDLHIFEDTMRDHWDRHPEERAVFDATMRTMAVQLAAAVVEAFDFAPYRTIVDVGGSHGTMLIAILQRAPHLQGVLFDLPGVAPGATPYLVAAGVHDRCTVVGGDMLTAVPDGGDLYLFSRVLHARNDAQAVTALRNCRRVIDPHGTLLIIEEVLPAGDAPGYAKLSDLNMLVGPGGQERTAAEYQALCAASNFALTQTLPTASRVSIMVGLPH